MRVRPILAASPAVSSGRWGRSAIALVAIGLVAGLSCRRTTDEKPVPALASSRASQEKMDGFRLRWTTATPAERANMRAELSDFVGQLEASGDTLEPLARAYLAIAWLDAGVPAAAEAAARPLVEGAPGVAHDLGELVKGAAARREGRSAEAIALLGPLVGKIIDPFARPLLDEELTEAYLDEGRYEEAIAAAAAWVRSASGDRASVLARVEKVLARVPAADALGVLDAARKSAGQAGYPPELLAILDRDVAAQQGVAVIPEDAGADASAVATARVDAAAAPVVDARFEGRAIGLLVPSSSLRHAATASKIARVAAAFVSPRPTSFDPAAGPASKADAGARDVGVLDANPAAPPPSSSAHRLAVFDTGGSADGVRVALDLAEHAGAAIVVGGTTELEANALAALAEARHLPAILLRRPSAPPTIPPSERPWFVSIGPSEAEEESATLKAADAFGADRAVVAPVPDAPGAPPSDDELHPRCDAAPKTAAGPAFPVSAWQKRRLAVVVVLGDAHCGARVIDDIASVPGYRPRVVFAPSALELVHEIAPLPRVAVGAGLLPADDDAPIDLRALWRELRAPVGWYAGLAHDAATLALAATPGLADAEEPAAIARARAATLDKLYAAHPALWTSSATAIDATGVVTRTFTTRAVAAGARWTPAWLAE